MSNLRQRLRSDLPNLTETNKVLAKIKTLLAQKNTRVVFEKGSFRENASTLNAVLIDGTLAHNNIQYQQAPFSSVAGTLTVQDLKFTGAAGNANDNSVTIAYTTGAVAGSEVVTVTGNAISIQIASGVSTATQVKAKFDASAPATALASCTITGTASNAQTAPYGPTNLAGGITAAAIEYYDTSDIHMIRRVRTKKYVIEINPGANPAFI